MTNNEEDMMSAALITLVVLILIFGFSGIGLLNGAIVGLNLDYGVVNVSLMGIFILAVLSDK
jgi:hypothetical protein